MKINLPPFVSTEITGELEQRLRAVERERDERQIWFEQACKDHSITWADRDRQRDRAEALEAELARLQSVQPAGHRPESEEVVAVKPLEWEAAGDLDAKDALLREAMEALKPFSVIADGTDFLGDGQSVSVNVNRCRAARALFHKLTEATKP